MRFNNLSIEKKIILIVTAGFTLVAIVVGFYLMHSEKQHLQALLLKQSRTMFTQIQEARHWNAGHGGVYVILRKGEKPNPYLYKVGPGEGKKSTVEPKITDSKGRSYALINPALMTRELAEESAEHTDIRFHLTSLKLVNPHNAPDDFEKMALHSFEKGTKEAFQQAELNGKPYFRYMAALHIEKACLKCHGFQGYKVGDIRGGISVSIPMHNEMVISEENLLQTLFIGVLVYLGVIALLILAIRTFVGRPLHELVRMSSRIGSGNFDTPDNAEFKDEVGSLWRTLSSTDRAIRSQREELESIARKMDEKSRTDALTQVHNRHHLYLEAPKLFAQAERMKQPLCVLMIDIDHFKRINDTYGHKVGDDVLKLMAMVIKSMVRQYDLFIRFGGEEFVLLMPGTELPQGYQTAERIRQSIEQASLPLDETHSINFQVSIGVYCSSEATMNQAIIHADAALYQAKNNGRNRVCVYDAEGDETT